MEFIPGIIKKCRWHSDWLDGAGSNRELLGQRKGMKIHQGAITHEICCLAAQLFKTAPYPFLWIFLFAISFSKIIFAKLIIIASHGTHRWQKMIKC